MAKRQRSQTSKPDSAAIPVVWLISAQDAWQTALSAERLSAAALAEKRTAIEELFRQTFPKARAIVVIERLSGYSIHPDKHVFRLEVEPSSDRDHQSFPETWARIVKTGPRSKIEREWQRWLACKRPSNDRGRALMALVPGYVPKGQPGKKQPEPLASLIYEDAQQTLHAGLLMSLEQAVLDCCRWGVPSVGSLLMVLDQVFAELLDRFYRRARTAEPNADERAWWRDRLQEGRDKWASREELAGGSRLLVEQQLAKFEGFSTLLYFVKAGLKFVPVTLRGPSHGDLHGRNLLIGLVDGEARWPALFDYEDMDSDGPLIWDFAKLETELKVRALKEVFPADGETQTHQHHPANASPASKRPKPRTFSEAAAEFEKSLDETTETLNNGLFSNWRDMTDADTPEGRLRALLLGIRRQAKKCLEVETKRGRRWLHEYYFGLAAYATYCGRFRTLDSLDLQAAYATGGVAAARFLWAESRLRFNNDSARSQAEVAIQQNLPQARLHAPEQLGHEPWLAFASVFARSTQKPFVKASILLLEQLKSGFPQVPEVWQELVLANLELARLTDVVSDKTRLQNHASELLNAFDAATQGQFNLDVETICRFGRHWKDRGDLVLSQPAQSGTPTNADRVWYQRALQYYQRAARIDPMNYYPAINVATLYLLLDEPKSARKTAEEVLKMCRAIDLSKSDPKELHWIHASSGEAHLILERDNLAYGSYRMAIQQPKCDAHAREVMWQQIQRVLKHRSAPTRQFDFRKLLIGDGGGVAKRSR